MAQWNTKGPVELRGPPERIRIPCELQMPGCPVVLRVSPGERRANSEYTVNTP